MSSVMELYQDNLRRSGLADAALAAPVDVPARRTVDQKSTVPVAVSAPALIKNEQVEDRVSALERFSANAAERLYKAEHGAPVRDTKVEELEARIAALENMLRPALAQKPISEMEQIELDYLALGETELTFHQFRCLPRVQRKKLLAGVGQ